jgi:hypothetical protein
MKQRLYLDDWGIKIFVPSMKENKKIKHERNTRLNTMVQTQTPSMGQRTYVPKNDSGKQTLQKGSKPDFNVVVAIKTGESTFWQKIGVAWNGEKGISIKLNALPMGSEIMLFPVKEDEDR